MFQTTNQIEVHLLLAATGDLKWVLRQNWSSVDPTCGEMAQIPVKKTNRNGGDRRFWFKDVTLWLFNIATENGPFIDGLPIKNGDFPWHIIYHLVI